jgi:hypothetical protein
MKKCNVCKLEKEDISKNGKCRSCNNEYMKEYKIKNRDKIKAYQQEYDAIYYKENKNIILANKKVFYEKNKQDILEKRKEYYGEHREKRLEYNKEYYQNNREKLLDDSKSYARKNKKKINEYHKVYNKNKRKNDINFRLKCSISANISIYFRSQNISKNRESTIKYLPYMLDELRAHIEQQFEYWMTWDNYGKYTPNIWNDNDSTTWTWSIDHIKPHSTFHYENMECEEFRKCWALSNLRPYSSKQNFLDGVQRIRHS